MDAFLSIIPSRIFVQNVIPISVLTGITSKGTGRFFLVQSETKMLLQIIGILQM